MHEKLYKQGIVFVHISNIGKYNKIKSLTLKIYTMMQNLNTQLSLSLPWKSSPWSFVTLIKLHNKKGRLKCKGFFRKEHPWFLSKRKQRRQKLGKFGFSLTTCSLEIIPLFLCFLCSLHSSSTMTLSFIFFLTDFRDHLECTISEHN